MATKRFQHRQFELVDIKDIAFARAHYLTSDRFIPVFEEAWLREFSKVPSEEGPYDVCPFQPFVPYLKIENNLQGSFVMDRMYRYHEVSYSLPLKEITCIVEIPDSEKYPFIFVSDEWFQEFLKGHVTTYALIDAIGVRSLIQKDSSALKNLMPKLMLEIDIVAAKFPHILFMSFADSVILKSNSPAASAAKYKPEELLYCYVEIDAAMKKILGLPAYGIFTQGINLFSGERLFHLSATQNHVSILTLGSPFAELMKIDQQVKENIRKQIHGPSTGYFSSDFYFSLMTEFDRRKSRDEAHLFTDDESYFVEDIDKLMLYIRKDDPYTI